MNEQVVYLVRSGNSRYLGVTEDLEQAMVIAKKEFKNYCDQRNIPTESGGVSLPDIRDIIDAGYSRWIYFGGKSSGQWTLSMVAFHEFSGLALSVIPMEVTPAVPDVLDYLDFMDHLEDADGGIRCKRCFLDPKISIGSREPIASEHEIIFWRIYNRCPDFKREVDALRVQANES